MGRLKIIFKTAANALFAKRSPATPVARGPVTPQTKPKSKQTKPSKKGKPTIDEEIAAIRRECYLEPDDPGRIDGFDAGTRVGTAKGR